MVLECLRNTYMNGAVVRVDGGIRMPPKMSGGLTCAPSSSSSPGGPEALTLVDLPEPVAGAGRGAGRGRGRRA